MAKENFNVEEYVHDGIMTQGIDFIDLPLWKDDNELSYEQKDEIFDYVDERIFDVEVNVRLRNPDF